MGVNEEVSPPLEGEPPHESLFTAMLAMLATLRSLRESSLTVKHRLALLTFKRAELWARFGHFSVKSLEAEMEIQPTHRRSLKGAQPANLAKHLIEPETFRIRRKPGKGAQTREMTTDYQSASG